MKWPPVCICFVDAKGKNQNSEPSSFRGPFLVLSRHILESHPGQVSCDKPMFFLFSSESDKITEQEIRTRGEVNIRRKMRVMVWSNCLCQFDLETTHVLLAASFVYPNNMFRPDHVQLNKHLKHLVLHLKKKKHLNI